MVSSSSAETRAGAARVARRITAPPEAEKVVTEVLVRHRLELPPGVLTVDLDVLAARVGDLTVGRLAYGRPVTARVDDVPDVLIGFNLRGRAAMSSGESPLRPVDVGSGVIFPTGSPAHVELSADCAVLAIRVSQTALEDELEHLLGRSLPGPLELDFELEMRGRLRQMWEPVLKLLLAELRRPTHLTEHPTAARHVQSVVLDALLLGHAHNHRPLLDRAVSAGSSTAVDRAVQLMESRPDEAWSTVELAREVHLSPRALQAGFRREVGMTPMDYLRDVRLRHVRTALVAARGQSTTVRAVATQFGFLHLGRFAATYRDRYGESPVETLRRPPNP